MNTRKIGKEKKEELRHWKISKQVDSLFENQESNQGVIVYSYMAFLKPRMKKLMIYALLR